MSLGYRDAELWSFSCEKIQLLARLAAERIERERAEFEFRMTRCLNAVMARFWSENGERVFREYESSLLATMTNATNSKPSK